MENSKIYIANWKMNFSFDQATKFVTENHKQFSQLLKKSNSKIVLCSSHTQIYSLQQILNSSNISIGAQNCSQHLKGAFTGEISVIDLSQIGCKYCIIGHSERRNYHNETNQIVCKKLENLINYKINPIVCIGEQISDYENKKTISCLEKQLNPILEKINFMNNISKDIEICIAYEPVWAIGSGKIPDKHHLENIFSWISQKIKLISNKISCNLIYGGSINSKNISSIKKIKYINGFLVGEASLKFQEFEKIINLQ